MTKDKFASDKKIENISVLLVSKNVFYFHFFFFQFYLQKYHHVFKLFPGFRILEENNENNKLKIENVFRYRIYCALHIKLQDPNCNSSKYDKK